MKNRTMIRLHRWHLNHFYSLCNMVAMIYSSDSVHAKLHVMAAFKSVDSIFHWTRPHFFHPLLFRCMRFHGPLDITCDSDHNGGIQHFSLSACTTSALLMPNRVDYTLAVPVDVNVYDARSICPIIIIVSFPIFYAGIRTISIHPPDKYDC